MTDQFAAALASLEDSDGRPEQFTQSFLAAFPVNGAAVSTLGDVLGSEIVSASDARATRIEELQFDLNQGPCWDAMHSGRAVLEPDVAATTRWPVFVREIRKISVASIFAFPVAVGSLRLGAVDLYAREPTSLSARQSEQARTMAAVIGRHVLRGAMHGSGNDAQAATSSFPRRVIHQAIGVVLAQLGISPEDAELMIRGHAFAAGRSMVDIATDIVEKRLRFERSGTTIEAIR